uniref:Putative secreted protein n=1 Tax=Ixodes ricinus TaxID=34613 RepID=A0A6B0U5G8_IXORI
MTPCLLKWMSMYLPNLLELSLRIVLAFPNASKIGLASRICCSIQECCPLMAAKYCRISFVLSVLPAPLSPLMMTHWLM